MGTAALVERLRAGDRDAFAEMYGEYASRIHGLCVSLLRDRDEAADAMQDTFVLALQRIGQLRDPERLRPWLFAIARHVCFRTLAKRTRLTPVERVPETNLDDDIDDDDGLTEAAAAALVWAAADGLNERDRAVLYLNLAEGLDGHDLAAALGVRQENPYSLLHRARAQLERAVGVVLVARLGRRDCATLSELVAGWDGVLTPLLRKRLGRHVDQCDVCQTTQSHARRVAALSTLALIAPSVAGAATADELFDIATRTPVPAERWLANGFPPLLDSGRRRRRVLLVASGLGVIAVVVLLAAVVSEPGSDARPADNGSSPRAQVSGAIGVRSPARRSISPTTLPKPSPGSTPGGTAAVTVPTAVVKTGGAPGGSGPPNNASPPATAAPSKSSPTATTQPAPPATTSHPPPPPPPPPPTTTTVLPGT